MAKPKIPNQKNKYKLLNHRLSNYVALVRRIYDTLNLEAAKMVHSVGYEGEKHFNFKDYPQLNERVKKIQQKFVSDIQGVVYSGVSKEWKESNLVQDLLADKVLKTYGAMVDGDKYKIYYRHNSDALKAFKERKDKGMNLSTKLWNQSIDYKEELEYAISSAIEKGTSAVTLSKRLSKYLEDFDLLKKDYKEKYGTAVKCKDCQYASIRLARSEINMSYRTAEQTRWQQMDFVVGFEIKLSHSHHHTMPHGDICDELAGKYPKDFNWTGWHPNDMCYAIPILKTEEEFWSDENLISKNEITDIPNRFKDWIHDNSERIYNAEKKGTLPYFLRDNATYYKKALNSIPSNDMKIRDFAQRERLNLKEIEFVTTQKEDIITEEIFSKNGAYNKQRKALQEAIIKDYIGDSDVKSDTIYMLGGAPANGKSTLVSSGMLPHPEGALVIDADEIKKRIPEYSIMTKSGNKSLIQKAANFVHEESSMVGKKIQSEALKKDIAFVIDGVNDGSYESVVKKVNKIRETTAKPIRIDYVTLDTDLSIKLAQIRAEKTGRVVPLSYIKKCNSEIPKLVPQLIDNKVFDELYLWDTNENGNPRLIIKLVRGNVEIVDEKLWERFLSKANL